MTHRSGLDGRDEPAREGEDHTELLSKLDSHDLSLALDVVDTSDTSVFETDSTADPYDVFPQSVASGGPTPTGVILWTRLDPATFEPGTPLGVQVARDPDFEAMVYDGVVTEDERIRAHDYTVKVDLDGQLRPDGAYFYRFVYRGVASRTGRCRTLPRPDDSPESVSFAVLTCQDYLNGYYPALHYVAQEDVDFVVHLGDFIYESDAGEFRGPGSYDYPGRVTGGEGVAQGERFGVEFMTPATTSVNVAEALHLTRGLRKELTEPLVSWLVPKMNPHIDFFDSHNWGYSTLEFTRDECRFVAYAVDKTENYPDADRELMVAYRVPEGVVKLDEVTEDYPG